jgi:serine/threonine protein kinase
MIGREVGNYKFLEKLSATDAVEVYKAVDVLLSRNILVKVLDQSASIEPDVAEEFRAEAATLAKLAHSSIPTLHSLTEFENSLLMITEYIDGESLDKVLERRGKISFDEAVPIFVKILDCLEYSHKFSVFHGNLKTSNVVLTDTEIVKILNFGVRSNSGSVEKFENITLQSQEGNSEIDATDDIYAVGAMFFEAITGKNLIDFENGLEAKGKLKEEMRKFLYSVYPFVPEEIKSAIIKAANPNRDERFHTASAFRDVLLTYGFDDSKVEEELSVAEKLISDPLPFTRLQPFGLTDKSDDSAKVSPPIQTSETVTDRKNVAVYSVNFSEKKSAEEKFKNVSSVEDDQSASRNKTSTARKWQRSRSAIAGASILAILVAHFVWQFYFVRKENLQIAEAPSKVVEEAEKQIVEAQPQYEAKNQENAEQPKIKAPVVESPQSEIKPSQTVLKKKAPVETRAERLRRVEKALTGI